MMKGIFLLLGLSLSLLLRAGDEEGYIIRAAGDTVRGRVDVPFFKEGLKKKQMDLAEFERSVRFSTDGKDFSAYRAGEIKGFGFNYEGGWFHFVVLDFRVNTWKKDRDESGRKYKDAVLFIHRFAEGAVPVYKHYFKYESSTTSIGGGGMNTTRETKRVEDVFVRSGDLGFVEVAPPNGGGYRKLKEFLVKYLTMEDAYLQMVSDKANYGNAVEVITAYNTWKEQQH